MKRVLVTGGCGYVGSQVIRTLAEHEPDEIRILDNLQRESHHALMDLPTGVRYRFFGGDLFDQGLLARALDGVDTVIHLAAIVRTPMAFENPVWMRQVNHWGTRALAEAALTAGVERFAYGSSSVVYGPGGPHEEDEPLRPVGPYAESKADGERALAALTERGLDVRVVRLGMVYGDAPGIRFDGVANRFVFQAATGRPITVHGSGEQIRPLVHVRDAARAFLLMARAEASGEPWRVANAVAANIAIADLAESVQRAHSAARTHYTDQDARTHLSFHVEGKRLRSMGWRPQEDHEEAIRNLLDRFPRLTT